MILDTTTKSLQVILAAAVATAQLPCVAAWADISTSAFTPGSSDTQTNGTTAVTLVAAPATSTQRQIKSLTVYNADTTNATVTVRLNNNSTLRIVVSVILAPGQTLQFAENSWSVIDNAGSLQESGGAGGSSGPGGSNTQIQFNSGGSAFGGDPDFTWNTSNETLTLGGASPQLNMAGFSGDPVSPAAGYLSLFARPVANRQMTAQVGPTGLDTALQPLLARNKVGYWNPAGNATTVPGVFGITAPTVVGTATSRTVAVTNIATRMRRIGYVSSTTAGSLAEARVAAAQFSCGSGSNDGSGFFFVIRWVPSSATAITGERNFAGMMSSTSAATNVDPSTLTNCVGVAQLSTDATQLYVVYGGTTAQAAIPLGTNFPGSTSTTTPYELAIFAPNSVANTYYYQVTNIASGNTTTGTLTGNSIQVPQNNTLLAARVWTCNNTTAAASAFDLCSIYIETDN